MRKRVLAIATLLALVAGVLLLTRGSSTPVAAEDSRPAPGAKASTHRCIEPVERKAPGMSSNGTASAAPSSPWTS